MLKTCNMSRALAKCFRSPSVLLVTSIILLSFTIHWILIKPLRCSHFQIKYAKPLATLVDNEEKVTEIFNAITRTVPSVYFTNISTTTSAKNSRGIILDLKKQYCVGDSLTVQVTMFDYVGKRKTYGGDFLRARIFSPKVEAGASGRIDDLNNGLYNVHFALFWEGNVKISILLMHPSEGVAALWRARNSGYKNIIFYGQYEYRSKKVQSECGFELDSDEAKCEYGAKEDKDFFYCIKPDNVSCESLISVTSKERSHTYLNTLEKTLFLRSNIGVEIPQTTESVDVMSCNRNSEVKPKCSTGMFQPFPSGYFLNNVWYPVFCNLSTYDPQSHISNCLSGKKIYIMGDSTLLQWTHYIASIMNSLKFFDLHASGSFNTLLLLDTDKNVYIHWKKHGHPLLIAYAFTVKDYSTVNQEIDRLEGGPQTVFVFSLGHHFRPFPITLFINRLLNTRKAIERLFLRSPDTKVIIRTENTREQSVAMDRFSDFYGYIQYQLTKDIFQGLNVGIIDAWDMSIASGAFELHPSASTVKNQINMFLKYIC
ncbi:NXPE family member 1 isoform X2 [Xenopus laevis]|uniref:NXPE family member 1 isoform X2 n=2 Tax=Xenopus laevis TaxID=8355 RepID=A0A8J1L958_XENLA|nr:NXPE family member 1 isoform X2 [Xenopus laevis]